MLPLDRLAAAGDEIIPMSAARELERTLRQVAEAAAEAVGLGIYDLVFKRSGPRWKLQVFLSRDDASVSLEDCERVSRQLSRELDVLDLIPHAYDLEVSSPGIDRPLRRAEHWASSVGERVRVKWRDADGKVHVDIARLAAFDDRASKARLDPDEGTSIDVPLDSVLQARIHVEW